MAVEIDPRQRQDLESGLGLEERRQEPQDSGGCIAAPLFPEVWKVAHRESLSLPVSLSRGPPRFVASTKNRFVRGSGTARSAV